MPDYSGLPAPKINGSCTHNRKGIIASKKLRRESSPGVLYTLALPRGTENTFARRMVLASRFRGSSLRLPLSGMVYCEIATRTLDTRLRVIKAGTEGGEEPWLEAPITCHGHRTLPSTPPRFSIGYLPLSKFG